MIKNGSFVIVIIFFWEKPQISVGAISPQFHSFSYLCFSILRWSLIPSILCMSYGTHFECIAYTTSLVKIDVESSLIGLIKKENVKMCFICKIENVEQKNVYQTMFLLYVVLSLSCDSVWHSTAILVKYK